MEREKEGRVAGWEIVFFDIGGEWVGFVGDPSEWCGEGFIEMVRDVSKIYQSGFDL